MKTATGASIKLLLLLLCALFSQLALAIPQSAVGINCVSDECFNIVRNPVRSAAVRTFCSSYIGTTVTAPVTVTQTAMVAGGTASSTISTTTTLTSVSTFQAPDPTILTTTTATTTTTITVAALARRQIEIPTFLSQCLGPSRISSACSCLLGGRPTTTVTAQVTTTETSTAPPERTQTFTLVATSVVEITVTLPPTNTVTSTLTTVETVTRSTCAANPPSQVVQNTGFESGLAPWTFIRSGNQVGFRLSYCGVDLGSPTDCRLTSNGCHCFDTNADSPGGSGLLQQRLSGVCPGQTYNFAAYFGRSGNIISGSQVRTTIAVKLDGVQIFPPTLICPLNEPCPIAGGSGPYTKIGPIPVVPQSVNPVLSIEFVSDIPANAGIFLLDAFVDEITLSRA